MSYVDFLEKKIPCTIGWPYTESACLYCDFNLVCVLCCGCFNLFCNMCGWVLYGVGDFVICVLVFAVCIVSFLYIYENSIAVNNSNNNNIIGHGAVL
jgi:hypothetical protein